MVLSIFACALLLALAALRWSMRRAWVLSLLAALASTLFVCVLPLRLVRGFDLGTFLVALPISICCWALAELVFGRRNSDKQSLAEPGSRPQVSLRSMVFGFTTVALMLGLMSLAKTLEGPRDVLGRFVSSDSGESLSGIAIWIHPFSECKPLPFPVNEPKSVVAEFDGKKIVPEHIHLKPGDTLTVKNNSQFGVSPVIHFQFNTPVNQFLTAGDEFSVTPTAAERMPVPLCGTVRPDYLAYVYVTDSPLAISDENGRWRLPMLPRGTHRVRLWRPDVGWVTNVMITGGPLVFDAKKPKDIWDFRLDVGLLTRNMGKCFLKVGNKNAPNSASVRGE